MLTQAQGGTDTETQKTLDTVKEPKSSTHFFKKNKKQKRPSKGQSPAEPVVKPGQQLHWEEGHHAARHSSTQGKGGESRLVWRCSVFGIVAVVLEELAQGCIHVVWTVLSYGAGGEQEKKRKEKKSKEKKRKDKKKKKQAWVCMSGEGAGNSRYLRDVLVSGASEEVNTRDVVPRKRGRQGLHIQVFMGQR